LSLGKTEGVARQEALRFSCVAPCFQGAAPPGAPRRRLTADGPRFRRLLASRSGRASALLGTEPLLPRQDQRLRTVSQLLAGGLSVPERSPVTARAREVRFPTPAGAAPCSIIVTPREDALGRAGQGNI